MEITLIAMSCFVMLFGVGFSMFLIRIDAPKNILIQFHQCRTLIHFAIGADLLVLEKADLQL